MNVSYWLIPAEPWRRRLSEVIEDLAHRFAAPVFMPHLTLYAGPLATNDRVVEAVAQAARDFPVIELRATGIARSAQFTKTLFIEFELSAEIARLSDRLKSEGAQPAEYALEPHVSLLYANLDEETGNTLGRAIDIPATMSFDRLGAILAPGETRTRADVEAWRLVADARLR